MDLKHSSTSRRRLSWILVVPALLLGAPRAQAQRADPVAARSQPVVIEKEFQTHGVSVSQSTRAGAAAKGAGIGLLVGALAGVAVGAMIESGNEGGSPEIRERYKGFAYAVFVPVGAVVGAIGGGIIGATKH